VSRDPRTHPQPGDELIFGDPGKQDCYSVISRTKEKVQYQIGPMRAVLQCSIKVWKEFASSCEIFKTDGIWRVKDGTKWVREADEEGIAPLKARDGSKCPAKRGTDGFGSTGR